MDNGLLYYMNDHTIFLFFSIEFQQRYTAYFTVTLFSLELSKKSYIKIGNIRVAIFGSVNIFGEMYLCPLFLYY
jgi:hypothetical protein